MQGKPKLYAMSSL